MARPGVGLVLLALLPGASCSLAAANTSAEALEYVQAVTAASLIPSYCESTLSVARRGLGSCLVSSCLRLLLLAAAAAAACC